MAWFSFKKKTTSSNSATAAVHKRSSSAFNISTMSSAGDIIKSVSQANLTSSTDDLNTESSKKKIVCLLFITRKEMLTNQPM